MSKKAMQAFLKMPQKFQDDVVKNMNWTSLEMDDILKDRKKMKKIVDRIDIDFEIAAFVTSIETMDDIQLLLSYIIELSTQDIVGVITFEDINNEEKLNDGDAASN